MTRTLAAAALTLAACKPEVAAPDAARAALPAVLPPATDAPEAGPTAPPPADIVLITVDGARADHLAPYGYDKLAYPWISALSAGGVTFTAALSPAPWSAPALASTLTGLYPNQHAVNNGPPVAGGTALPAPLSETVDTLAEQLARAGYATFGVTTTGHAARGLGLDQGFDTYLDLGEQPDGEAAVEAVTGLGAAWSAADRRFLWVHLSDPVRPYEAREPWITALREAPPPSERLGAVGLDPTLAEITARYDAELAAVDDEAARIAAALSLRPDALVVFAGTHGEELLERGRLGSGDAMVPEVLRVPLIAQWPGVLPAGARVTDPVSLTDVLPTLLDAATGAPPAPPTVSGMSLLPAARGAAVPERALPAEVRLPEGRLLRALTWRGQTLVRVDGTEGILSSRLLARPGAQMDRDAASADHLSAALDAWLATAVTTPADAPEGEGDAEAEAEAP